MMGITFLIPSIAWVSAKHLLSGVRQVWIFASLLATLLMCSASYAASTVARCATDDAPNAFETEPCNLGGSIGNMCAISGDTLTCGNAVCDSLEATAVTDYLGNNTISAWGTCENGASSIDFCCVLDDSDDVIDRMVLAGTPGQDFLKFYVDAGLDGFYSLENHRVNTFLAGIQYGGADMDTHRGSYADSIYYKDYIYGNGSIDTIDTFVGNDYADGGTSGDFIAMGPGEDLAWGKEGADEVNGNADNDCLVDMLTCPTVEGDVYLGAEQNDRLWVSNTYGGETCVTASDFTVDGGPDDGGADSDVCGDSDWGMTNPPFVSCAFEDDFNDLSGAAFSCAEPTP